MEAIDESACSVSDEDFDESMGVEVSIAASSKVSKKRKVRSKTIGSLAPKRRTKQLRIHNGKLVNPPDEITASALHGPAKQFQQILTDENVPGAGAGKESVHKLDLTSGEVAKLSMPNLPDASLRIDEDALSEGGSFKELLTSFREIPSAMIDGVNVLFDTVPIIRTVFDLSMNALLSGGINVSLAALDFGEATTRYSNMIWSTFARDLVMALWKYGFAPVACERHNNGLNFPRVLDVTQLKVMIRPSVYGLTQYVFFTRQDTYGAPSALGFGLGNDHDDAGGVRVGGRFGDRFDPDKPLTGIHVFRESEPTAVGVLTSRVYRCLQPWNNLKEAEKTYQVAQSRLANPMIVTGRPEQRDQIGVGAMGNRPHAVGMRRRDANANQLSAAQIRQRVVASLRAENANANIGREVGAQSSSSVGVEQIDPGRSNAMSVGVAHVMLPIGRQIQSQRDPTAPDIIAHRAYFEETMSMIFQVPRSVFSATGSGLRSTGAQATANEVWQFGQRHLRQQVLTFVYQMYHLVRTGENVRDLMTRAPELCATYEGMMKAVAPRITIGSIPTYETMRDLYVIGLLKYSAFVRYAHASEGIPLCDLEPEAQPKLIEPYVEDTIPITEPSSSSSSSSSSGSKKPVRQQRVLQRASKGKSGGGGSSASSGASNSKSLEKALQLHAPKYG